MRWPATTAHLPAPNPKETQSPIVMPPENARRHHENHALLSTLLSPRPSRIPPSRDAIPNRVPLRLFRRCKNAHRLHGWS